MHGHGTRGTMAEPVVQKPESYTSNVREKDRTDKLLAARSGVRLVRKMLLTHVIPVVAAHTRPNTALYYPHPQALSTVAYISPFSAGAGETYLMVIL